MDFILLLFPTVNYLNYTGHDEVQQELRATRHAQTDHKLVLQELIPTYFPCFLARSRHTCSTPALAGVVLRSIAATTEEGTLASWKLIPSLFPA